MTQSGPSPTLTDGVVVLRPAPAATADPATEAAFLVEVDGAAVGEVAVHRDDDGLGALSWAIDTDHRRRGYGVRAVTVLVDYAFERLDLDRVEAHVPADDERSKRLATRAGLRREGTLRRRGAGTGERHDVVVFARLHDDPPISDPESFRALLNSFLPRKRAIAQMLVRDPEGRVLLCHLTYKKDWDLPGGVVEVNESPQLAVSREVEEELALQVKAGGLLLTDWLPPWSGWEDAVCLVFDGGVLEASVLDQVEREVREIRGVEFCTPEQVRERCADFTARRVEAALANLDGGDGPTYTESGR